MVVKRRTVIHSKPELKTTEFQSRNVGIFMLMELKFCSESGNYTFVRF